MSDPFTPYETGLAQLLERMGSDHPRCTEARTLQSRLLENVAQARLYGDTGTSRAERAQIVHSLNRLAEAVVGVSFTELCELTALQESRRTFDLISNGLRILAILVEHSEQTMSLDELRGRAGLPDEAFDRADNFLLKRVYVQGTPGSTGLRRPTDEGIRFWEDNQLASGPGIPVSFGHDSDATEKDIWQQRLCDLADNIAQDLELLKEYEDTLRYEDEPRRKVKYRREIERLRRSATRHQGEFDELQAQVAGISPAVMQDVAVQLQQMNTELDKLLSR
jgi:hypothetical protein